MIVRKLGMRGQIQLLNFMINYKIYVTGILDGKTG